MLAVLKDLEKHSLLKIQVNKTKYEYYTMDTFLYRQKCVGYINCFMIFPKSKLLHNTYAVIRNL